MLYSNSTTQVAFYQAYTFSLTTVGSNYILIHLEVLIAATEARGVLLVGSKEAPPFAYIDTTGKLQTGCQYADLPGYSLKKTDSFLQLNTTDLHIDSKLYLGVMAPDRPAMGLNLQITVQGHGDWYIDGDLCPLDCSERGGCMEGQCKCDKPWGDVDCSLRISYLDMGQKYDLIVSSDSYRYFTTIYGQSSTVHLSLTTLQGNAVIFVSFGK